MKKLFRLFTGVALFASLFAIKESGVWKVINIEEWLTSIGG